MTPHDAILWGAAILTYGFDDYVTTVLEVRTAGVQEDNPLMRRLSDGDSGPSSFAVLKLVSVALFFAAYWALKPAVARLAVPLSLAVFDAVVTARSTRIIHHRA